MALKDYIMSISDKRTTERTLMLNRIAEECGVNLSTVYKWIYGQAKPDKLKKQKIAEITGISVEKLFSNNEEQSNVK